MRCPCGCRLPTAARLILRWASRAERNAGLNGDGPNHHPTVKPLALMRYLCRLTRTPTGGTVLDPFAGSGTTGLAALHEGRDYVLIEQDADYAEIARRRCDNYEPDEAEHDNQMALL